MLEVRLGKMRLHSHNGLLTNYSGADGMKTGFICDSGFNVVASATREGRKLVAVVLGEATGADRTFRAANLLEHGFQMQWWKAALFTPQTLDTMPIPQDAKGPTTMRQAVVSYECGTGGRRAVAKARKKGQDVAEKGGKVPAKKSKSAQRSAASQSRQ
jgi:D-alanyl-D-alanine carboxypeptidase